LYEAAEIDRISWWRQFTTITFPYVRSLLLLAVLFRTIETFKIFDLVYILTNGGPGTATETIAVLVYRMAFQYFRTSNSTALGYILIFIVIVLTSLYLYVIKKRESADI
jgi:multiple sugar transport system permease protein